MDKNRQIEQSWDANAETRANAVREGTLPGRLAVPNQAIVEAVGVERPCKVLDVGCGEGWLSEELAKSGCEVVGFDGHRWLIGRAHERGGPRFLHLNYAQWIGDPDLIADSFDRIVCNYSLFEEDITALLRLFLCFDALRAR
jgi:2-polyprenyl-3-methyl-5-hydroxy-6-metoxy-1,4-benzoquinol methylase